MKPEALLTMRPLSPRFASLEKSLTDSRGHSNDSSKNGGEPRLSPRILERKDEPIAVDYLALPEPQSHRLSPVPHFSEVALGFDFDNLDGDRMSLSLEKTPDSDSISIATRPLLEELQEAGFSGNTTNGYFGTLNDIGDSSELTRGRQIEKEEAKKKTAKSKQGHLRQTSPSRIPRLTIKGAGGSAEKNKGDVSHKSESQNTVSDLESLKTAKNYVEIKATEKRGREGVTTLTDTSVKDLQQTQGSNMERKLLSTLPKKLKEEAVLRTLASNLKLASATSKSVLAKKQTLEGRQSVDSGRESVGEEENRPRLYRFDSNSSVSSVGSARSATRTGNGTIKPWSVAMAAENIKKRRGGAARKRTNDELDTLKKKVEQSQAKSNSLEAELEPLREKLRRYEGIIESLEDKIEESKQEMLVKERDQLAKIDRLERAHSKELQNERYTREEVESDLKDKVKQFESEVKFYKKQVDELEDNLAMLKEGSEVDEDNSPAAKQLSSLRKELVQVREVLATSEKERLNERKEKLSALQNMIKLTKSKSDVEEELDERKKADTKENSDKYMQLSGKLAVSEMKLQKLRKDTSTEIEQLQKKHLEEIRTQNAENEKVQTKLRKEIETLRSQLKELEDQHRPSSPGRNLPYHGRWSAMRSESRKHLTEMKEIISALEKEGLGPEQCSSEEVVRVLFTRQKDLAEKLKETEDVLSACKNGDPRPIIQELKAEKKTLKRTVDDLRQNVSSLESHLKLTEMTSKRQLEDLLAEKKSSFLQLQKSMDDYDAAKIAAEQAQKDLVDTKSMLNKRQNELQLLRDNLLNVTNEMKTVDADLGKTRKDLSIKSAELERVKRDLVVESERVQQERKNNSRVSSELETKKRVIKESEKFIAELESKVQRLSENLEASQMHINRASSERDSAKEGVLSLQEKHVTNEAELRQANSVVANLKNQIKSLEYTFQEKVDKFASISSELEKAKVDCLGASHLLGIEEERNKELEDEVDDLTYKLTEKTEEVERLLERIKVLEDDLDHATSRFDSIQLEYAETETSLKSHESSKVMLAKELNTLQVSYRDISREKQRLQDILEETKRSLQQKSDRMISLDKEFKEHKHQLKEKTRYIQEVVSERDSLQEKLTYQQTQTELLTENLDTAKSENRKQFKDIETLKSQMNDLSERRGSLSEELKKLTEEHRIRLEKDQTKLKALQHEKDVLIAEIKAAQNIIRKQLSLMGLYDAVDGQEDDEIRIKNSVESILQKLSKTEKECRESKAETRKLKKDMDEMSRAMSDENVSLANELQKMKDDVYQELQKEKNKYDEEIKQARGRIESQKDEIHKIANNLTEAENKTTEFQQLIDERESQLRMITSEKVKLVDSVEFLQQEIQKADANLLEKEKELQSIKSEKEVQVSSLTTKQEQILNELRDANEKLAEKENDQFMKAAQVNQIVDLLRKENEEMKTARLQIEVELSQLENELKKKEDEKKTIAKSHKEEIKSLNQQVAGLEEKVAEQEYLIEKSNRDLEKKARENSNLNKKVKQLIEESELVGDQGCQVAQVQQVESAGVSFEAFEAEEKVDAFAKEKEEIKQKYEETMKELERQRKVSQAKIQLFQQKEKDCQKLKQEIEYERREKIEALNCLKAMIVDNEAMATCVNGLQETVALQRQENTDTRRHLQEVLEKYEMQREVSMRTQKTFEDLIESKMSYDHQENRRLKQDFEHIKREKEKMTFQIEQKDKELERVTAEVDELKGLVETKIVNFEVEKRARELLESKFQQFSTDSSFAQRRLLSMEDSQKDLHDKLVDLQKWHNSLEVTLLHGSPQSSLSINDLYEDQKRREIFLNDQVSALTEKYKKLGDDRQIKENKNVFSEER